MNTGRVEALVVNTVERGPGQIVGMGSAVTDLVDAATGGVLSSTEQQLRELKLALQLSIVASLIAGVAGLAVLFSGKR